MPEPHELTVDGELLDALRDLVAAHVAHKKASRTSSRTDGAADPDDKVLDALLDAERGMAREGNNVAILAMQRGIKPSEES